MLLVTPVASGDKLALLRRARGLRSRCVCIVSISYTPVFFNTLQLRTIIAGASDSCTVSCERGREGRLSGSESLCAAQWTSAVPLRDALTESFAHDQCLRASVVTMRLQQVACVRLSGSEAKGNWTSEMKQLKRKGLSF